MRLLLLGFVACDGSRTSVPFEVWVANEGAGEVLAYDGPTGALSRVVLDRDGLGAPSFSPSALARVGDGWAVADFASGDVLAFQGDTVTRTYRNRLDEPRLEEPSSLVPWGDRIVALGNDTRNLVALGPTTDERVELGDQPILNAHAVDLLGSDLFVVGTSPSTGVGLVQVWDPHSGALVTSFGGAPDLEAATDVVVDGDRVVVVDWVSGRLGAYDLDGAWLGELASGLDRPIAAVPGPEGEWWVLTAEAIVTVDVEGAVEVRIASAGRWDWARDLALF